MSSFRKVLSCIVAFSLMFPATAAAQDQEPPTATAVEQELTLPPRLTLRLPQFEYSLLKSGQRLTASRDTILMTTEEFARITIEFDAMQSKHNLYLEKQLRYSHENYKLKIDTLTLQNSFLERELSRTNELLLRSQELKNKDLTPLWVAVGFVAGALATIGIAYAVAPAGN